jgi:PIN domain nuclease of toxin-antitoxin system
MTLLLDTHTVLWLTEQIPKLGKVARESCARALSDGELSVPTVVFFELGWALRRGRIAGLTSIRDWRSRILSLGVREIGFSAEIAIRAAELDGLHGDPFDRIIVATTTVEDATLLTADRPILDWPGRMRRQDARR